MTTPLKVSTEYVNTLSAKHEDIAGQISDASSATDGQAQWMWVSHGLVCAESNSAMQSVESARQGACSAMESMSDSLSERLTSAADMYDEYDEAMGRLLDRQMRIETMETK